MDSYQQLLKTASASISKFVQQVDDAAAFGYLAENNSDEFSIDFSDDEKDETGQAKAILTDKDGTPLDIGDNQVKAKIMDAKIAMAKEQRKLLRETILMGITRLVVEKGNVKAAVIFDIKAKEQIKRRTRPPPSNPFRPAPMPGQHRPDRQDFRGRRGRRQFVLPLHPDFGVIGQERGVHRAGRQDHRLRGYHLQVRLLQTRQLHGDRAG